MEGLDKKNIEDIIALTPMQEGMLFHYLKNPKGDQYVGQLSLDLSGKIDIDCFEKAWNLVIEKNEMLRTVFRWEKAKKPIQVILKYNYLKVCFIDYSDKKGSEKKNLLEEIKRKDRMKKFDLHQVPFRVTLVKIAEKKYSTLITNHHILYDGWSNGNILRELFQIYGALIKSRKINWQPVTPFRSYIKWLKNRDKEKGIRYWQQYLQGYERPATLPKPENRDNGEEYKWEEYDHIISESLSRGLRETAIDEQVSLNAVFNTLWGILLQRYNNTDDVVFGGVVSGRPSEINGVGSMVGLFINTIPVRINTGDKYNLRELLKETQDNIISAAPYEFVPLADIQSHSQLKEELIDHLVIFQNYPIKKENFSLDKECGFNIERLVSHEQTNYDFNVVIYPERECLVKVTFNALKYPLQSIKKIVLHFNEILRQVTENVEMKIADISLLTPQEKKQLLHDFNRRAEKTGLPDGLTIGQRFEKTVEKSPDSTAVIPGNTANKSFRLTYKELNERAGCLAKALKEKGVKHCTIVPLLAEPTNEMIIGIMALLKIGSCFLPIDPESPRERVTFMIKDTNPGLLLTQAHLTGKVDVKLETLTIEEHAYTPGQRQQGSSLEPGNDAKPQDPVYMIYTSGTTGKPKGVLVKNINLCNYVDWVAQKAQLTPADRTILTSSFAFDLGYTSLFSSLLCGGQLHILPKETYLSGRKVLNYIEENEITFLKVTPSLFSIFVHTPEFLASRLKSLRLVVLGGEAIQLKDVEKAHGIFPHIQFMNHYGPTEATIGCIARFIDFNRFEEYKKNTTIGKPIDNAAAYILDRYLHMLPVGVPGELCLSGTCIAGGYLNRPELTAEKFCPGLYRSYRSYRTYIYKTGDLARWMPDGNIEFLGRIDHQVKVRGFRIELGEIENRLMKHKEIKEALLLTKSSESGDKYLCAYIVFNSSNTGGEFTGRVRELRRFLSRELPDYMIPHHFVPINSIPLTPNGKIDRKALPEPDFTGISDTFIAPRNETEHKLAEIWAEVLEVDKGKIGIDDNFFELGGHSIKVTHLIGSIHKAFDVEVPIAQVFDHPTIRELSLFMSKVEESRFTPLQPVEKKEYYMLSSAQSRLFILYQMAPRSTHYNMPEFVRLEGEVKKAKFEESFIRLIRRHESLRISIEIIDTKAVNRIHRHPHFKMEYIDLSKDKADKTEDSSLETERIISHFVRPFDLVRPPLFRAGLIKLEEKKYILMFDMHHIISDGSSLSLYVKEFMAVYSGVTLPPLRLRYMDYSEWQKENREKERQGLSKQKEYWLKEFPGQVPLLDLPTDYVRPDTKNFAGSTIRFEVESRETALLKSLAAEEDATLFMVLLAVFNLLLMKLSGQEDIVVGSPVECRKHQDLRQIIGMFINMLAIRNRLEPHNTFRQILREVRKKSLGAFENQEYPFDELVEQVSGERDASRNPLFDVLFTFQKMVVSEVEIPGLKLMPYEHQRSISKFDLGLTGTEVKGKLVFSMEYCSGLFKKEAVQRFSRYFKRIITGIIENKGKKLPGIEIISQQEKQQILLDFSGNKAAYPRDITIHRRFEEQVRRTPDRVALVGQRAGEDSFAPGAGGCMLSYRELNQKSNQLAVLLRAKGVQPDTIVGLMMESSPEMIIGILGILKAGGAYMPIDPGYPAARINYMLKDSNGGVLVTTPKLRDKVKAEVEEGPGILPQLPLQFINFEPRLASVFEPPLSTLTCQASPANLAYIIYTSGSTGKAKGVMVEHCSAVNLLSFLFEKYPILETDAYLLKTPLVFDVSVSELFGWFWGGSRLVILEEDGRKDPWKIIDVIELLKVTHINFVPAMFAAFVRALDIHEVTKLTGLKYIFLAGEALLPELVIQFRRFNTGIPLENLYGPTEATVYASKYSLSHWHGTNTNRIPIGKPLDNIKLYIVDREIHLQPVGILGELCISGAGLARGYVNRSGLTAEKFDQDLWDYPDYHDENNKKFLQGELDQWIGRSVGQWVSSTAGRRGNGALIMAPRQQPETNENQHKRFAQHIGPPRRGAPGRRRQKIYRTGDLARWLEDGNIEFFGRLDQQVKIRGFRIELGEIESQLQRHDKIKEAVVITNEDSKGDSHLCAYVVPYENENQFNHHQLREYLAGKLPGYMVPAYFVQLEKLPLTPSGKVDRKKLPAHKMGKAVEAYAAPRNETEETLIEIWHHVLGIEKSIIGIDNNFFKLGGHSLKAIMTISNLHKKFDVKLSLTEFFKNPTIRMLSGYMNGAAKQEYTSLKAVEEKEYYPLSSAQERLYVLWQIDRKNTCYNISQAFIWERNVEPGTLERIFMKLIERHESLRTSFDFIEDKPVQKIHKKVKFKIEYYRAMHSDDHGAAPTVGMAGDFIKPFDLAKVPLLRVGLLQSGEKKTIMMIDMHHIVTDAISNAILLKDFVSLFKLKELAALKLRYKDYSEWWNSQKERDALTMQENYWLKEFAGDIPILNLPIDFNRPAELDFAGSFLCFEVDKKLAAKLKNLVLELNTTLNILLLAVYCILLAKYTGQEDFAVGIVSAGRQHADLQSIIGFFVNLLAIRNRPQGNKTFVEFLKEVNARALKAYENQDYPFEKLVNKLGIQGEANRHPLIDAVFTAPNIGERQGGILLENNQDHLGLVPFEFENKVSRFDLLIYALIDNDSIIMKFEYSVALFKRSTIQKMSEHYAEILQEVTNNRDIYLKDIPISHDFVVARSNTDILKEGFQGIEF